MEAINLFQFCFGLALFPTLVIIIFECVFMFVFRFDLVKPTTALSFYLVFILKIFQLNLISVYHMDLLIIRTFFTPFMLNVGYLKSLMKPLFQLNELSLERLLNCEFFDLCRMDLVDPLHMVGHNLTVLISSYDWI